MSKKAAASQYCFEEVHYAVDSGKCVLPVMIEPCFEQITGKTIVYIYIYILIVPNQAA